MKKYNPDYHNSIVANVRLNAKNAGVDTAAIADETIYEIWSNNYFTDDVEGNILIDIREMNIAMSQK